MKLLNCSLLLVVLAPICVLSQSTSDRIQNYLNEHREELKLTENDVSDWIIYDEHTDSRSGLTHAYVRQTVENIEVYNSIGVFVINGDEVVLTGNSFISDVKSLTGQSVPSISAQDAILNAAKALDIESPSLPELLTDKEGELLFGKSDFSLESIPAKLTWVPTDGTLLLAWDVSIYPLNAEHWWSLRINAVNGDEIDRVDWVSHCSFSGEEHVHSSSRCESRVTETVTMLPAPPPSTDQYNVFALPIESPNHGTRSLVLGPFDATASPWGWHDTNGSAGAESTLTRGNNVRAYEDENNNNAPGYSPDGTAALDFDFPLNMQQVASNYHDPAITNLFYMNNMMHDIWYHYGFDEASGNFQENNYGNGGAASDRVNAEAQDGSGMNNANFATPPDGSNPRMQMYLWNNPGADLLTVNSPSGLAGGYTAEPAVFGPALTATPITSNLVIYDDNVPDGYDACETPMNAAVMNGNIVLIRRGSCNFTDKVVRAENAGATAVIMVNNVSGAPITMGGTDPGIGIPSVMISDVDGAAIIAEIESGGTVNGTLVDAPAYDLDGDFDNGIIAHEYGHGISIRLTGGASNSNCLNNDEQMGEGWSDWFALMLTMEPSDLTTDNRGIGTFVTGESPNGVGIRPAPYNTDMGVNGYTYAATNNTGAISQPHGIGFVWCTMLWDMNWALIDEHGFDPNLHTGTGGNNIAMQLVIEALKLQPCSPGFEDGRDAIIQADQLLYGGAHECLLWNVFANRGLGYSADQGNTNNRTDQVEAFDLPPHLVNVSGSETVNTCSSYTWAANGITYSTSGTYTEVLTAASGCDSTATLNLTISPPVTGFQSVSQCGDYTWSANNTTYSTSGTYTATLTAANGCDSIATLNLTITNSTSGSETVNTCNSYTWSANGNTYTNSGSYTEILTSLQGCDSIATLNLTINSPTSGSESVTSCSSYQWSADGNTYSTSGTYTAVIMGSNGCDSTATLNLTIASPTSGSESISTCNSNYTWAADGNTYSSDGTYTAVLTGANGCDSTATLNLTFLSASFGTESVVTCNAYTWPTNGQTYTNTGVYSATLQAANGCDSIVTLNLTMSGATNTTSTINTCDPSYTWSVNNTTYTTSGTYTVQMIGVNGCDSTHTLNLTVNGANSSSQNINTCESYTWSADGQTYYTSGTYTSILTNVNGCDSTVTLNLTISNIDLSVTNTSPTLTSNESGATSTYQWIDCTNGNVPLNGENNQSFTATTNGDYAVVVSNGPCSDTSACVTVSGIGLDEFDLSANMNVFPNPTSGELTIEFGIDYGAVEIRLINSLGQIIDVYSFDSSKAVKLTIDEAPGAYILEVVTDELNPARVKVLKE